jgi:transposase-like protein
MFVGARCQTYIRAPEPKKISTLKMETILFAEMLENIQHSWPLTHENRSCTLNFSYRKLKITNFIYACFNVSKMEVNGFTTVLNCKYFRIQQ